MDAWLQGLALLGLVCLLLHELDAVYQHEWRIFLGWTGMSDALAYRWFTGLHLPLLLFIIGAWQTTWMPTALSLFLVGHGLAHWVLRHHPLVTFNHAFSQVWIHGGALCGLLYVGIRLMLTLGG